MNKPAVSIILPTYNRAHTLGRAIRSVLNQTFDDFEVIVVDDASTDNTKEIPSPFDDPRIVYLRHDTNLGGAAARNTGLSYAKAFLVAFQDSDDEWLPDKLEKQVRVLQAAGDHCRAAYCGMVVFAGRRNSRHGKPMVHYVPAAGTRKVSGNIQGSLLHENFVSTQTLLVERAALQEIGGFDRRLPCLQDWDLALRLSDRTEFAFIDEPLVLAHVSQDSISHRQYAQPFAKLMVIKKQKAWFEREPKILANHLFSITKVLTLHGKLASARKAAVRAISCRPFYWKCWASYFLTFLGPRLGTLLYDIRLRKTGAL